MNGSYLDSISGKYTGQILLLYLGDTTIIGYMISKYPRKITWKNKINCPPITPTDIILGSLISPTGGILLALSHLSDAPQSVRCVEVIFANIKNVSTMQ